MTKTAAPALVISTAAKRSGEISLPDGTASMEPGNFTTPAGPCLRRR